MASGPFARAPGQDAQGSRVRSRQALADTDGGARTAA
jgi:hypothetical protein